MSTKTPYAGDRPLLSVVITSYAPERLGNLQELVDSLQAQSYGNLEIVFVGERYPSLIPEFLRLCERKGLQNVTTVFNHGTPGLSPARNLGAQNARGEIIAFIDDDAVAFPDWGAAIVETFAEHQDGIGVTGPAYPLWEDDAMAWFPEEFLWMLSCRRREQNESGSVRKVRNAWGVNMAFRREAFACCQFSETFIGGNQGMPGGAKAGLLGDDTDFCIRLRERTRRPIYYCPAIRVYHQVPKSRLTNRSIRRRSFWEGYTKAVLAKLYRGEESLEIDLSVERALLRRILLHLLPAAIKQLPTDPLLAAKKLQLIAVALSHTALGYASAKVPLLGPWFAKRYA